jgi:hypothetical protein
MPGPLVQKAGKAKRLRKANINKFKCGYPFLIAVIGVLGLLLVSFNLKIAGNHTAQIREKNKAVERLKAPTSAHLSTPVTVTSLKSTQPEKSTITEKRLENQVPSPKQQERPPNRESQTHLVFSTSCSYSHDWQAYLFFFHAMLHNQPGNVTRIVSGCEPEQEVEILKIHQEQIAIMNERFHIHFTPEFGRIPGKSWQTTKYWNKPFGIKHWLETKFGYKYEGDISTPFDDDIVILVDPDMLLQRPFVNDFSGYPNHWWQPHFSNRPEIIIHKASQGQPIAQDYSFGSAWLTSGSSNLTHIVGPDSPVHKVTLQEAKTLYPAGPPFVVTARDMYRIAYNWADFLPRLFDIFPKFMSEMYGYCLAAAHLGLKHQMARGFMVSNVGMTTGEGWNFLDTVTDDACRVSKFKNDVPHVIHFCQRYSIGEYFLSKYKVPVDILSCDHPLLELPPLDIAATTHYSHYGDGSTDVWQGQRKYLLYRHAFMVCSIMPALNKAATFYKDHHCPNGANYNQTWNHFRANEKEMAADAAKKAKK